METITLYPEELVCHYTVDVYDVENISGIAASSVDATLSGMAEGYGLGARCATDAKVTMPFVLSTDRTADRLHGEFLTFGECTHTTARHIMTVYMVLADGSRWYHTYDVTDQVQNAPDPRHVHIEVRGLPLPEPPTPKTGGTEMSANVNDWQVININLKM